MQSKNNSKDSWTEYVENELTMVRPILFKMGFEVDDFQPHLKGERYLMQAVTTKNGIKLILISRRISDGLKVVIKTTRDAGGIEEIQHERRCKEVLQDIKFAHQKFLSPPEVLFSKTEGFVIYIQEFIEQESSFLERTLEQQFYISLESFKAQESAKATAYKHLRIIKDTFEVFDSRKYLEKIEEFSQKITSRYSDDKRVVDILNRSLEIFKREIRTVGQYCGFLTHVDFVPHNIRVSKGSVYLLDHSSLRFGNKYEGWARFLNFMSLHNPELEKILVDYVKNNRSPEETKSLRLMRIFRLTEIVWYYINNLDKSSGNLFKLNEKRVFFWLDLLESIINNSPLDPKIREEYTTSRDNLRSEDEKIRQVGLL